MPAPVSCAPAPCPSAYRQRCCPLRCSKIWTRVRCPAHADAYHLRKPPARPCTTLLPRYRSITFSWLTPFRLKILLHLTLDASYVNNFTSQPRPILPERIADHQY